MSAGPGEWNWGREHFFCLGATSLSRVHSSVGVCWRAQSSVWQSIHFGDSAVSAASWRLFFPSFQNYQRCFSSQLVLSHFLQQSTPMIFPLSSWSPCSAVVIPLQYGQPTYINFILGYGDPIATRLEIQPTYHVQLHESCCSTIVYRIFGYCSAILTGISHGFLKVSIPTRPLSSRWSVAHLSSL